MTVQQYMYMYILCRVHVNFCTFIKECIFCMTFFYLVQQYTVYYYNQIHIVQVCSKHFSNMLISFMTYTDTVSIITADGIVIVVSQFFSILSGHIHSKQEGVGHTSCLFLVLMCRKSQSLCLNFKIKQGGAKALFIQYKGFF